MASETKIREEKEEEKESSLVSTKVPKARVRFIRRVLRRSFSIRVFLFSLCCAKDEFSPLETLTFVFPLFFFNACSIYHARRRGCVSLFFLSLCSLSVEKTFLSAMVMTIVYVVYVRGDQTTDDLSLASVWEMN